MISDSLTLNNVDTTDFGYTRVFVDAINMTIEQHPETNGGTTKTPEDMVITLPPMRSPDKFRRSARALFIERRGGPVGTTRTSPSVEAVR